ASLLFQADPRPPDRPRQASTDQRESADRTEPKLAAEPTESTDAIEPADPIDKIDPAEPMDRIEPAEPMDRIDPLDPMLKMEPSVFRMRSFSQEPPGSALGDRRPARLGARPCCLVPATRTRVTPASSPSGTGCVGADGTP